GLAEPYEVITRWSSAERLHARGTLVPKSRGARCPDLPVANPCFLTDGSAAPVALPEGTNDFHLELKSPMRVRVIMLRGALENTGVPVVTQVSVRAGSDSITVGLPDE